MTLPPNGTLRIAVPNKGSLSQAATEMLRESGYRQRQDAKELTLVDVENGVEFYYLRPRDIALYVGEGTLDIGITGRDLLLDSGAKAEEVLTLGFGRSRFQFAGPVGEFTDIQQLAGRRIATSYVGVVRTFLEDRGIDASVVRLDGAVETSVRLEVAKRRLEGVLVARTYVMMDYDIATAHVDAAVMLTPGIEGPTISPLHR